MATRVRAFTESTLHYLAQAYFSIRLHNARASLSAFSATYTPSIILTMKKQSVSALLFGSSSWLSRLGSTTRLMVSTSAPNRIKPAISADFRGKSKSFCDDLISLHVIAMSSAMDIRYLKADVLVIIDNHVFFALLSIAVRTRLSSSMATYIPARPAIQGTRRSAHLGLGSKATIQKAISAMTALITIYEVALNRPTAMACLSDKPRLVRDSRMSRHVKATIIRVKRIYWDIFLPNGQTYRPMIVNGE